MPRGRHPCVLTTLLPASVMSFAILAGLASAKIPSRNESSRLWDVDKECRVPMRRGF